jgi:beta-barrel assembly-enhancing protease
MCRQESVLLCALVLVMVGCATTTTRPPSVSPEEVTREEQIQREIVLGELRTAQARLDRLIAPLLVAALPLCEETVGPWIGFRYGSISEYRGDWAIAARDALGLSDTLAILSVTEGSPAAKAGLHTGDRILEVQGRSVPVGRRAPEVMSEALEVTGPGREVTLVVRREAVVDTVSTTAEERCAFGHDVVVEGDINAFADGERVIIPWAMMRFARDEELLVVLAHEIAHNAMRHVEAMRRNMLWAGLFGALADASLAYEGVDTGGAYTEQFMQLGAMAYSQDFEREADYVGMYILARAGIELDSAPSFWRRFAQINPAAIGYASSHPTTAERFVRLRETAREIEEKKRGGMELLPERRER